MATDWFSDAKKRALGQVGRDLLTYVYVYCDHAGFFRPDEWDIVQMRTGFQGTPSDMLNMLQGFVFLHPGGVWQVVGWYPLQFPKATREKANGFAASVLETLDYTASLLGKRVLEIAGVPGSLPAGNVDVVGGVAPPGWHPGGGTPGVPKGKGEGQGQGKAKIEVAKVNLITPFDADLAALKITFKEGGLSLTVLSAKHAGMLATYFEAHGSRVICEAARLYCQKFESRKIKKCPENFIEHADAWVADVKPDTASCPHVDMQHVVVDLDAHVFGAKEIRSSCPDCGLKDARRQERTCPGHKFELEDMVESLRIWEAAPAKVRGSKPEPIEVCIHCGAEPPQQQQAV